MRRRYVTSVMTIGAAAACILAVGSWQLRWGATGEELDAPLAGDDFIANPDLTATRAITVGTSADQVWPWIAQLGQGQGGFYSYDVLENLVGCDIYSADQIILEWQAITIGGQVKLHPEVGLDVAMVEPGRALVLRGGVPMGTAPPPYDFTWVFVLQEQPEGTTRLFGPRALRPHPAVGAVAGRAGCGGRLRDDQRILRGIRDRAERSGRPTA